MNTFERITASIDVAYRAAVAAIGRAWRALGGGGSGPPTLPQ